MNDHKVVKLFNSPGAIGGMDIDEIETNPKRVER